VIVALALIAGGFVIGRIVKDNGSSSATPTSLSSDRSTTVPRGGSTTTGGTGTTTPATRSTAPPSTVAATPSLDPAMEPAAAAAKAIKPAVVQLETGSGLGSGFIFTTDGHILTAAHVVGNSKTLTIRLGDGRTLSGTVLGSDRNTDVAVVKMDPIADMPVASLALNIPLQVGQAVLAVGSPFGLDQTVTAGIVSSVNRPVEVDSSVVAMVQTDASINPGNSGGALVDMKARVIGINDQIASSSGDNAGVGFAIPIDTAYDVAQRIINNQPLDVGYLGIAGDDTTSGQPGALVTAITPASPAAKAGVKVADVIVEFDNQPIRSFAELVAQVRKHHPGDKLQIKLLRSGTNMTVDVTLGKQ
jgi:putative serine protease PepD